MSEIESVPSEYGEWFISLKRQIRAAQQRAALAVNRELVQLYWNIGQSLLLHKNQYGWGAKVIKRISVFSQLLGHGMKLRKNHLRNCLGIILSHYYQSYL